MQGMACVFIRLLDASGRTVLRVPCMPQPQSRPLPTDWLDIMRTQLQVLPLSPDEPAAMDPHDSKFLIAVDMWGRGGLSIDALSQRLVDRVHQALLPPKVICVSLMS